MRKHINAKLKAAEKPPIDKKSSKDDLLRAINAVAGPEAYKTPRSLVEFAEDMGSRAFALGGKNLSGDPVAIMSSIMLGFKREAVLKDLARDLLQAGMPEFHEIHRKAIETYGFQPIPEEAVLAERIMKHVQAELNFQTGRIARDAVGPTVADREPGHAEWKRRLALEGKEKVDIGENFEILINDGRKTSPFASDIDTLASVIADDLIERSGIKSRGVSNFDRLVKHEFPDGSVVLIHETLKEVLDQLIDIVNPGKALGYLDQGVRHDVLRSIDADLTVKSHNRRSGVDSLKVGENGTGIIIQSREWAVFRALSQTFARTGVAGVALGAGTAGVLGVSMFAGSAVGAAAMYAARGAYEAMYGYRKDPGLSSVDADLAAVVMQSTVRSILLRTMKEFNISSELRLKIDKKASELRRAQGFAHRGGLKPYAVGAVAAGAAGLTLSAGWAINLPLLAIGTWAAIQSFDLLVQVPGYRSKFTSKEVRDGTLRFIRDLGGRLATEMEFPEDQVALKHIEAYLTRENEAAERYNTAIKDGRLETGLALEMAENKLASASMEWHEKTLRTLTDIEGVTASLKFAVTSLRTTAYWAGNFLGLFQQSLMGQGLTPENMAFLAGGAAGGTFGGLPGAMVGAQAGRMLAGPAVAGMKKLNALLENVPFYSAVWDAMNSVFGGKMRIYGGPSSLYRTQQILQVITLQEKTPAGGLAAAYGAMAGGAFGGPVGAAAGGLAGAALASYDTPVPYLRRKALVLDPLDPKSVAEWTPIVTPSGRIYTLAEFMDEARANKVFSTFVREETGVLVAQELRATNPGFWRNVVSWNGAPVVKRMLMDIADSMDLYYRIGMFAELLEEGYSPKAAGDRVRLIFFDYSDLSDTEKKYFRNIFMFYSFARKNLELYMHMLYHDPAKIMGWFRLQRDLQMQAYNTTNPEMFVDDWFLGRLPLPFFTEDFAPMGDGVQTIPGYDGAMPISPMMGHYDSFNLMANLPALMQGDVNTAMKYAFSQVTPLINIATIGLTEEIPFSGMPLEKLEISPHQIIVANQLAQVTGHQIFGPNGLIDYKVVNVEERFGEDFKKSKDALRREFLNQKAPHAAGIGKFQPRDRHEGMKYYMLDQIALPVLAGMPVVGPAAYAFGGPSGKQLSEIDKGDLLTDVREDEQRKFHQQWGLLAAAIEHLVDLSGAYTTEELLKQADHNLRRRSGETYDQGPDRGTEALRDEYRRLFLMHFTGEEAGMIFDLYISPKNVPKGFWESKMIGLRLDPVRAPEAALDNQVDKMLRKAADQ